MENKVVYTITLNDLMSKDVARAEKNTLGLDRAVMGVNTSLKSLGRMAATAFGAFAVLDVFKGIVSAGSEVETATIGLTTLLKDSAAAQQVVANTMEDAARTPFDFSNLLDLNKMLISAQVPAERARVDVLNLANAVAATGGGNDELSRMAVNLQQIKTVGKATAMDIRQFAMSGINIYQLLANATGENVEEVQKMTVTYDMLTAALAQAAGEGGLYAGGLDALANSTAVQISNLGDKIFQLGVRIFDYTKPAIDAVISALGGFIDIAAVVGAWVVDNIDSIGILAATVTAYTIATNASAIAAGVATFATNIWTTAQTLLNAAMNANPIGIIILAVGGLIATIRYLYKNFEWARGGVLGLWEAMKELVSLVKDHVINTLGGLGKIIQGIFTLDLDLIKDGLLQATETYRTAGQRLANAFSKGYSQGVEEFRQDEAEKSAAGGKTATPLSGVTTTPTSLGTGDATAARKVQGQKVYNININIENLVKDFRVQLTNITDTTKIKEKITEALLGAVNDSQIVAG